MCNIIIYGIGKRFDTLIMKNKFVSDSFKNYRICGLIDQNKCGQEFIFNDRKYTVTALEQWTSLNVDKVIVTTGKYFDEISGELERHGFKRNQICLLDEWIRAIFEEFIHIEHFRNKHGLEIGGPSSVFSLIYDACSSCDGVNYSNDTVWWQGKEETGYTYHNKALGKIIIADATNLSVIPDEAYDFVMSSNNLEHIANPMKAAAEFRRILRKGGMCLIVVPNKEVTFDHDRQYTPFEHILEDYQNNTGEDDLTHLPEIIKYHDYDMDTACGGIEAFKARADKNIENRCLHHHVFDEKCLTGLFGYFDLKIVGLTKMQSNYWIVGMKNQ